MVFTDPLFVRYPIVCLGVFHHIQLCILYFRIQCTFMKDSSSSLKLFHVFWKNLILLKKHLAGFVFSVKKLRL